MTLAIGPATPADSAALAQLLAAVGDDMTARHGKGHWSSRPTEAGVLRAITNAHARVLVARRGAAIVGTLQLVTKKPWAIDAKYFSVVETPLYMLGMAVEPALQRAGIGRELVAAATVAARAWPAGAIRLDAYDSPAGAGGFYAACGYAEVGRASYRGTPLIYYELVL